MLLHALKQTVFRVEKESLIVVAHYSRTNTMSKIEHWEKKTGIKLGKSFPSFFLFYKNCFRWRKRVRKKDIWEHKEWVCFGRCVSSLSYTVIDGAGAACSIHRAGLVLWTTQPLRSHSSWFLQLQHERLSSKDISSISAFLTPRRSSFRSQLVFTPEWS